MRRKVNHEGMGGRMSAKSYKFKYNPDEEQLIKDLSIMSEELQYKPMTYEEALRILRYFPYFLVSSRANGKTTLEYRRFEAFCKAFEALEKQIPKKPIIREAEDSFGYVKHILCPNCEKVDFGYERPCFCKHCGQAIDWEES